mgnify:CR=1 FL=1
MKKLKKIFVSAFFLFATFNQNLLADSAHFIDFSKVLNKSIAGASAQKILKSKLENSINKYKKQEDEIRKEEQKIISQRKLITNEEYQKKVEVLRKKVAELQKNKKTEFNNIAKSRQKAKKQLLKKLNPIMKKYMEDNKIRLVVDKKSILLGDEKLEITDQIIEALNKELKSLKIN